MNVADAIYGLVHDYPGGAEALGPRLGKRGTSLSAEALVRTPSMLAADQAAGRAIPKFGVLDAVRAMNMAGDYRVLYAIASECSHYPPLPMPTEAPEQAQCMRALAGLARDFAALVEKVSVSTADERVMRGAHYLSHSLWTAWICWTVSALSWHAVKAWQERGISHASDATRSPLS